MPVVDSLEKALQLKDAPPEAMREGVELTLRQLKAAFAKGNLKEIDPAVGEKFDPHFHQAISTVPAKGVAPNHVVSVLQKGWLIADRVLAARSRYRSAGLNLDHIYPTSVASGTSGLEDPKNGKNHRH